MEEGCLCRGFFLEIHYEAKGHIGEKKTEVEERSKLSFVLAHLEAAFKLIKPIFNYCHKKWARTNGYNYVS